MIKQITKRIIALAIVMTMMITALTGCGGGSNAVTFEEIDPNAVTATIDGNDIEADIMFYFLYYYKWIYENYYGITDWSEEYESGVTYGDLLKQDVETEIKMFTYTYRLKDQYNIEIGEEDLADIRENAAQFIEQTEKSILTVFGFTEEWLESVFTKLFIQNEIYAAVLEEYTDALTDEQLEEAKHAKVQHILLSFTPEAKYDEDGNAIEATEEELEEHKKAQLTRAEEVLTKINDGEDFDELAEEYNEDGGSEYYLNQNGTDLPNGTTFVDAFVQAALKLKTGEVSGIVESEYGYHIIRCIDDFDEEYSETAKSTLASSSISEAYTVWAEDLTVEVSDFWTKYKLINPEDMPADEVETVAPDDSTETDTDTDTEADTDADAE